ETAFFTCDLPTVRVTESQAVDSLAHAPNGASAQTTELGADLDREAPRRAHRFDAVVEEGEVGAKALADLGERGVRALDAAVFHNGLQQRLALQFLVRETDDVVFEPVAFASPKDLLCARHRGLAAAQFQNRAAAGRDELIGCVEPRLVAGGAHLRADAVSIKWKIFSGEFRDIVLVETAAGDELDLGKTRVIENAPHLASEDGEVAAVDARAAEFFAARRELVGDRDGIFRAGDRIVGIEQEHTAVGKALRVRSERVDLALEARDERMRHRAHDGNGVSLSREYVARAGAAGDIARARDLHAGINAVRAPEREVDDAAAAGGGDAARRLGRDHRLEIDLIDEKRLDDLRLDDRRGHFENRLVGEKKASFGQPAHAAGEAQRF